MNNIQVISENHIINNIEDNVIINTDDTTLIIKVIKSYDKPIIIDNQIYKNINIFIEDNIEVSFLDIKDKADYLSYKYNVGNNSKIVINKYDQFNDNEENIEVNLEGYKAEVLLNLGIVSLNKQIYNININHLNNNTVSNVINRGIALNEGVIEFNVNGNVRPKMSNCYLNQDNKIITMDKGKGIIKPNLYIEDNMVEARHGASIGKFNEEVIFYLGTRGINEKEAYKLLIEGFLFSNFNIEEKYRLELVEKLKGVINK